MTRDEAIKTVVDLAEAVAEACDRLNGALAQYQAGDPDALTHVDEDLDDALTGMRALLDAAPQMRALL